MDRIIISTKGKNKTLAISGIVCAVFGFALGFGGYFYLTDGMYDYPSVYREYYMQQYLPIFVFLLAFFVASLLAARYLIISSTTYVDVYENRVEGKSLKNLLSAQDFRFDRDKITNVTCSGSNLYIHTASDKFTVVAGVKIAKEVYDHFTS